MSSQAETTRRLVEEMVEINNDRGFKLYEESGAPKGHLDFTLVGDQMLQGWPMVPLRVKIPERLNQATGRGIATVVQQAKTNLTQFIDEHPDPPQGEIGEGKFGGS